MSGAASVSVGAVLHVGCGSSPLPEWIKGEETRVDIDPAHNPDVVASMTALGDIGPFDMVFCSHALEHLSPHDVVPALGEFHRVLSPGGMAWVVVPDLEGIKPTFEVVYESAGGPITGFHMIYGDPVRQADNPHMAHHCGFVSETLEEAFNAVGFSQVHIARHSCFNLVGIGIK